MQAKQEKWDLYDQQGRKTGKTIQAGENVPYGYCLYCVGTVSYTHLTLPTIA